MTYARTKNELKAALALRGKWRIGFLLLCAATLQSCALANIGPADPPKTFDLQSASNGSSRVNSKGWQLLVNEPSAVRALETDRVMVKPGGAQISYYGKAVWSDKLPRLLQARLVQELQNSGRFRAVATRGERIDSDIGLSTEIRAFQIEIQNGKASAHIQLFIKLVDEKRGRVVSSKLFTARVPTQKDNVNEGIAALNKASQNVLKRVTRWAAGRQARHLAAKDQPSASHNNKLAQASSRSN